MSDAAAWLEARMTGAPPALADQVRRFVGEAGGESLAARLAAAGDAALAAAEGRGPDRAAALDLLAADALITLALLAVAERQPAELAPFASRLRVAAAEGR